MSRISRRIWATVAALFIIITAYAGVPHKQMLDAKIKKLPQGKSLLFITDTHWGRNAQHSTEQMKYVSDRTDIRTVVFAGDSFDWGTDCDDALRQLKLYTDGCVGAFGEDFHYVIGNHDANSWAVGKGKCPLEGGLIPDTTIFKVTQSHIQDKVVFDEVGVQTVQDFTFESEGQKKEAMAWMKMHWYRDIPSQKIRLIALETGNRGYTARLLGGSSQAFFLVQTDFVAKALETMPAGYDAVIVGHQMGFYKGDVKVGTDVAGLRQMMQVVSAYATSSKVEITSKGVPVDKSPVLKAFWTASGNHAYDFSAVKDPGKVILLGGHFHRDMFWLASPSENGLDVEQIDPKKLKTIEKGQVLCFWVNRDVWKGPKVHLMEKGQPTEQSFMAVTMEKNKIIFTRFGAGNDYKFKIK